MIFLRKIILLWTVLKGHKRDKFHAFKIITFRNYIVNTRKTSKVIVNHSLILLKRLDQIAAIPSVHQYISYEFVNRNESWSAIVNALHSFLVNRKVIVHTRNQS